MIDGNTPADAGTADSGPVTEQDLIADIGEAAAASEQEHTEEAPAETAEGETTDEESTAEDDETEGTEEETAEAEQQPDDKVKVKLDDGAEVTLSELKKGFLRQSDYTRKTQEVASDRKAIEAAAQRLTQADQAVRQQLDLAVRVIQANIPKPPDAAMIQTDVVGYLAQKEAYDQRMAQLHQLTQASAEADQRAQQTQGTQFQQSVQSELQMLTEKVPEFRSPEKRTAFMQEAADIGGRAYGLSAEEIGNITDHRVILALRDAVAYRKLQSAKMSAVAKAKTAPPIRPAVRQAPGTREAAQAKAATDRVRQTGRVEDLVNDPSFRALIS